MADYNKKPHEIESNKQLKKTDAPKHPLKKEAEKEVIHSNEDIRQNAELNKKNDRREEGKKPRFENDHKPNW